MFGNGLARAGIGVGLGVGVTLGLGWASRCDGRDTIVLMYTHVTPRRKLSAWKCWARSPSLQPEKRELTIKAERSDERGNDGDRVALLLAGIEVARELLAPLHCAQLARRFEPKMEGLRQRGRHGTGTLARPAKPR